MTTIADLETGQVLVVLGSRKHLDVWLAVFASNTSHPAASGDLMREVGEREGTQPHTYGNDCQLFKSSSSRRNRRRRRVQAARVNPSSISPA